MSDDGEFDLLDENSNQHWGCFIIFAAVVICAGASVIFAKFMFGAF